MAEAPQHVLPNSYWTGPECWTDPGPPRMLAPPGVETVVAMVGSGTVPPNPYRRGPAGAIIVNDTPYLIDAGEGVWRGLVRVATAHDGLLANALLPTKMSRVFLTHLHSDHTVGLPSLMLLPWPYGRTAALEVHGAIGVGRLVSGLLDAYHGDLDERLYGPEKKNATGWKMIAHEIQAPGPVYEDENIRVDCFHHPHGSFVQNFGYRFETKDRVIVWAGDGQASDSFEEAARDADLVFCELASVETVGNATWGGATPAEKAQTIWAYHMKPDELAQLATNANVKTLVLHHECNYSEPFDTDALLHEMKQVYDGNVISARDADIF